MKKTKNGYSIGESISIHKNIMNPDDWCVTIRSLGIYSKPICRLDSDEEQIIESVYKVVIETKKRVDGIWESLLPELKR